MIVRLKAEATQAHKQELRGFPTRAPNQELRGFPAPAHIQKLRTRAHIQEFRRFSLQAEGPSE
jgi:hypothetical protein